MAVAYRMQLGKRFLRPEVHAPYHARGHFQLPPAGGRGEDRALARAIIESCEWGDEMTDGLVCITTRLNSGKLSFWRREEFRTPSGARNSSR